MPQNATLFATDPAILDTFTDSKAYFWILLKVKGIEIRCANNMGKYNILHVSSQISHVNEFFHENMPI